jgi:hypothetical protein
MSVYGLVRWDCRRIWRGEGGCNWWRTGTVISQWHFGGNQIKFAKVFRYNVASWHSRWELGQIQGGLKKPLDDRTLMTLRYQWRGIGCTGWLGPMALGWKWRRIRGNGRCSGWRSPMTIMKGWRRIRLGWRCTGWRSQSDSYVGMKSLDDSSYVGMKSLDDSSYVGMKSLDDSSYVGMKSLDDSSYVGMTTYSSTMHWMT